VKSSLAALFVLSLSVVSFAQAQSFSSLEERMSAAEFKAAGLDKLSAEELAKLNDWLRAKGLTGAAFAAPVAEDRRGFAERSRNDAKTVVAKIPGSFTGWDGSSTFRLDNGQVWQVTEAGAKFKIQAIDSPTVQIKRGLIGDVWYLKIDGYGSSVKVKRLQ